MLFPRASLNQAQVTLLLRWRGGNEQTYNFNDNESDNKYKYVGCRNGCNLLPEQSRIAVKQPVCPAVIDGSGGE